MFSKLYIIVILAVLDRFRRPFWLVLTLSGLQNGLFSDRVRITDLRFVSCLDPINKYNKIELLDSIQKNRNNPISILIVFSEFNKDSKIGLKLLEFSKLLDV